MSAEENASRLIYRHVAGLEQKISLLESKNSALEDRVTALVDALKEAADVLEWTGAKHASARARDAIKEGGVL